MKRIIALLVALLTLVAPLSACTPDAPPASSTTVAETTAAPTPDETTAAPIVGSPDNLTETPATEVIYAIAPDAKRLNCFTRGKEIILTDRDSADDVLRAFTDVGYYDYPISRIEGAKFTVNFLQGAKHNVTVYHFPDKREVRIIWDDASTFDTAVLAPNAQTDTGAIRFVQVGIDRVGETDNPLNGMMHVARLADGRAIIIDGGHKNIKNLQNLLNTLAKLEIARDADGKYIIAAWLITHAHSDHIGAATHFITSYAKQTKIENVIYHFSTDASVIGSSQTSITDFLAAVRRAYPDVNHIIPHAGMQYFIGNATFSILYVPELIYAEDYPLAYFNDSSIVFRLGVGETAVFEMGDAGNAACEIIHSIYAPAALKSNILQITHHGLYTEANSGHAWRFVKRVYEAVDADLAILGMHSKYPKDNRNGRFTVMGQWAESGHQISYVMNRKDHPFAGNITQAIWDLFEIRGIVDGKPVDTLFGYDGVNRVTNEAGMVTYLGANRDEPMVTVFDLDGKTVTVAENQALASWLG